MSDDENEGDSAVYSILFAGDAAPKAFVSKNGTATASFPSGDAYTGPYQGGKRQGQGTYTWNKAEGSRTAGAQYTGEYKEGQRHGTGVMRYPDGSKFTGEWKANKREGQGTYVYKSGDRYCGTWAGDKKAGPGTYLYAASQTQLTGLFDGDTCSDGTWEYYDGKSFACKFSGADVVAYGDRQLAA